MSQQKIDLDCWPGDPRPGDLIGKVIKDTGLPIREDVSRFFGWWIWDYSDIDPDTWKKAKPILARRIKRLYARGIIRYGAWD